MKRIVVASYKKSGATWFRFLVYGAERGLPTSSKEIDEFYPYDDKGDYIWPDNIERGFVKTHASFYSKALTVKDNDGSVLIIRNPFEIIFSWLAHMRLSGCLMYKSHNVLNHFQRIEGESIAMTKHWNSWKDKASVIIRYEDMIKDVSSELVKVNKALDLGWSDSDIETAVQSGNKERMAEMEGYEIRNKIEGGFFYKLKKADPYLNRGERFIGGKRRKEDMEIFLNDCQDDFLRLFTPLADELKYDLNESIDKWKKTYSLP